MVVTSVCALSSLPYSGLMFYLGAQLVSFSNSTLQSCRLEYIPIKKDLGILINHDLSWNHHNGIIFSKA